MSSDGGQPKKMLEADTPSKDVERGDSLNGENEVLVFTTDDTSDEKEESRCKDCPRCRFVIAIIVIIAVIVNLLILLSVFNAGPEQGGITASIRGGSYSKKTCVNFDYGCCEIYDKCKVVTTN